MEHFNPGLQKLVALGNAYVKAFQGEEQVWCGGLNSENI